MQKKNSLSGKKCDESFCLSLEKRKDSGRKSSENRQVKSKFSTKLYQISELHGTYLLWYIPLPPPPHRGRQTFVLTDISFLNSYPDSVYQYCFVVE